MRSPVATDRPRLLPTLTALRWYAALAVFLFHGGAVMGWPPSKFVGMGQAGVTFFFVLSGFVLTWSARPGQRASDFYLRRFARIYPSHALVFALAVVIGWYTTGLFTTPVLGVVLGFLLLQAWTFSEHSYVYAGNAPSWSLSVEALFYAAFPALLPRLQRLATAKLMAITGLVVTAGAVATILLSHAGYGSTIAFNFPIALLPKFVLGVALAMLMQRWLRLTSWPLAILIAGISAAAAHYTPAFPFQDYVLLPGIVALLVCAVTSDLAGRKNLLTSRVSVWLGEVSFAFYLVHEGALLVLDRITPLGGAWAVLLGFVISLGLAAALHHLVELPVQRLILARARSVKAEPRKRRGRLPTG